MEAVTLTRHTPNNNIEKRKMMFARRKSMELRRIQRKRQSETDTHDKYVSTDSDTLSEYEGNENYLD